jgi:hypothetical protein
MKAARFARCFALVAALAVAGCSESESIRVLDEPKPSAGPTGPAIPAEQKQYRTLAAMVPADEVGQENGPRWWFFKMSGKADLVGRNEAAFNSIIQSVRTQAIEDNPIAWTLPQGWTREKGDNNGVVSRFATLKSPDGQAEIAVTKFGGLVSMNVQRWWKQLWGKERANEITPANVFDYAKQRTINGRLVITVDFSGPKDPNAKDPNGGPMMNPHHPHGGQ